MNKTRKAIIELIEPYMDKILSEGCYIKWKDTDIDKIVGFNGKDGYGYPTSRGYLEPTINKGDYKILGHYDITAVLKYINNKNHHCIVGYNIEIFRDVISEKQGKCFVSELPNKPLHLYTEKEEKELLDLILKLNK